MARAAAALGLPATVLRWHDAPGSGNLQAAARAARTRLLAGWASAEGLSAVALGHTQDDQAETVLMRLARGSGVAGLGGMAEARSRDGVLWLRPLLGFSRSILRDWLVSEGIGWVEDPSNADPRFERVRARHALVALAPLGIDAQALAETAARARAASLVLDDAVRELGAQALRVDRCGALHLRLDRLAASRGETTLVLLSHALRCVGAMPAPPRHAAVAALWAAACRGQGHSLHGCLTGCRDGVLWIAREPAAAAATPAGTLWDGRWHWKTDRNGQVAALGEAGLSVLRQAAASGAWTAPPGWSESPRPARLTTPALWCDDRLACAPCAAYGEGLQARWTGLPTPLARADVDTAVPPLT